jgi:hypothetical protein
MKQPPRTFVRFAAYTILALATAGAQSNSKEMIPDKPFMATHLIRVPTSGEKVFVGSVAEMNAAIAKAGCQSCVYHIWKVAGTQVGVYNFLMSSTWAGRDVYVKIHESDEYKAAVKKHPEADPFFHAQVYNRYVEVPVNK